MSLIARDVGWEYPWQQWGFIGGARKVVWPEPEKEVSDYYRKRHPRVEWSDVKMSDAVFLTLMRLSDDHCG